MRVASPGRGRGRPGHPGLDDPDDPHADRVATRMGASPGITKVALLRATYHRALGMRSSALELAGRKTEAFPEARFRWKVVLRRRRRSRRHHRPRPARRPRELVGAAPPRPAAPVARRRALTRVVQTGLARPLEQRPHDAAPLAAELPARRVALARVEHLERHGLVHGGVVLELREVDAADRGLDDRRALVQQVPGDPRGRDVGARARTAAASARRCPSR